MYRTLYPPNSIQKYSFFRGYPYLSMAIIRCTKYSLPWTAKCVYVEMHYGSYGGTTSCMEVGRLFVLPCMFMAVWYAMVAMDPFPPDIHEFADAATIPPSSAVVRNRMYDTPKSPVLSGTLVVAIGDGACWDVRYWPPAPLPLFTEGRVPL